MHDDGVKTVLGRTGNFDGDQVLDILLRRARRPPSSSPRKLWREFVSPDPDEAEVRRIAQRFRDSRYDIKVALHGIFTSDAFYASENRGVLVKSPIELVVGTLRQFDMKPAEADAVCRRGGRHGSEPLRAAQRQGLARTGDVDQRQHAARAASSSWNVFFAAMRPTP